MRNVPFVLRHKYRYALVTSLTNPCKIGLDRNAYDGGLVLEGFIWSL